MNTETKAMPEIKLMSAKDLVKEYNAGSGRKPIVKFVDRPTAERRVKDLRIFLAPKAEDSPPPRTASAGKFSRSDAIAQTWLDKEVSAKRAKRDGVSVDGIIYKSTHAAFQALGLPANRCIKFRAQLKAAGELSFQITEGTGKPFAFKIVKEGDLNNQ